MALKKCKECGVEISTEAKQCPQCGKPQKKSSCLSLGCLIIIILALVLILSNSSLFRKSYRSSYSSNTSIKTNSSSLSNTQLEDKLKTLYETGLLIKFDIDLNKAYVDPILWSSSDIDTKKGIGVVLAEICHNNGSTGWVVFYNNNSGVKLAKYSRSYGYTRY